MRTAFPRCCQGPFHRSFGVTFAGAALVSGKGAALTVRGLSFFEFGHAGMREV
jgi:hypothetical protein